MSGEKEYKKRVEELLDKEGKERIIMGIENSIDNKDFDYLTFDDFFNYVLGCRTQDMIDDIIDDGYKMKVDWKDDVWFNELFYHFADYMVKKGLLKEEKIWRPAFELPDNLKLDLKKIKESLIESILENLRK